MKYRSRVDIASQILESANGGATKTKIMYESFMSYGQLKEYLSALSENGLISYNKGDNTYKTTEKGMRFLRMYKGMSDMLGIAPKKEEF